MVLFAIGQKWWFFWKFMALESLGGGACFPHFLTFEQFKQFQMHIVMFYTLSLDA
jgi:hypothetical protein